ncbi:MAG: MBL fold metallo-hydrolase [Candidatus Omnitrophica bacterium]|nr:MBL fold metallo-hydrolase [Candidatus Omnitrophota bacterium]
MQVRIIFDKDTLDKNLHTGWGVSYLIDGKILFDTGGKFIFLLKNMQLMNVDISAIEKVVISHDHWDHRGGLWGILKKNPELKVYTCPHFSKRFKNRIESYGVQLIEVDNFTPIGKNVYTTGEIGGRYAFRYMPEQALVLETREGLTILTGCAHPGIIKIIENVKQNISGNIYLVLGGFHLMGRHKKTVTPIINRFKQLEIEKVAPSHCTGKATTRLFQEEYGDNFIEVKVGQTLEV